MLLFATIRRTSEPPEGHEHLNKPRTVFAVERRSSADGTIHMSNQRPDDNTANGSHREQFARAMKQLLVEGKLNQTQLVHRLRRAGFKVSKPRVSEWVNGHNVPREEELVRAIARIAATQARLSTRTASGSYNRQPLTSVGVAPSTTIRRR